MNRRANKAFLKTPKGKEAVAKANKAFYKKFGAGAKPDTHEKRKFWMDLYVANGGKIRKKKQRKTCKGTIYECLKKRFIKVASIPPECYYLFRNGDLDRIDIEMLSVDDLRTPVDLGLGTIKSCRFPSSNQYTECIVYTITPTDGDPITLIAPFPEEEAPHPPLDYPPEHTASAQKVANSTSLTSGLDVNEKIVISPNESPDNAFWAKEYKKPNFEAAAETGGGETTIHTTRPTTMTWEQYIIDETFIHETGHNIQHPSAERGIRTGFDQEEWNQAKRQDNNSISKYGEKGSEDFCESLVMYMGTKNTPCEDTVRKLYPNRYKLLDELMELENIPVNRRNKPVFVDTAVIRPATPIDRTPRRPVPLEPLDLRYESEKKEKQRRKN